MGPNYSISTACATANFAYVAAANHIRKGDAQIMIAGGAEAPIIPVGLGGFVACRSALTWPALRFLLEKQKASVNCPACSWSSDTPARLMQCSALVLTKACLRGLVLSAANDRLLACLAIASCSAALSRQSCFGSMHLVPLPGLPFSPGVYIFSPSSRLCLDKA